MKRIILAMLLVAAVTAVAQTASAPAQPAPQQNATPTPATPPQSATTSPSATPQQTPAPPSAAAPPKQKKEIKDPAEYNAYVGALQQQDAAAKVSGFEAFLTQYPNSVMKEDALELLMGAYQQLLSQAKAADQQMLYQGKMLGTAQKVLLVNPCNLRVLALLVYSKQAMAAAGQNSAQNFAEAGQAGEKGLQCLPTAVKPEGMSDADFQKLKSQTAPIYDGSAGVSAYQAAVAAKSNAFAKAEQYLRAAVEADPTNLLEVYDLALAYLAAGPAEDDVNGLFFIARASNLAQGEGKTKIAGFGKSRYSKYHGSEEGWSDLLAKTATVTLPDASFTVTKYVPPTPAEQCAGFLKTEKTKDMPFVEWQLCLSAGTPDDAAKVWSVIKGNPLRMAATVISVDTTGKSTKLQLAGSGDDADAKRADIDLTMAGAILPKQVPKEGDNFEFEGTPVSYVAQPFMMTMNDGAMVVKAPPKAPVHKKPVAH